MELRKLCNHVLLSYPQLTLAGGFTDEMVRCSGKFWVLDQMLVKLFHTKHRILLFSTMTRLLDLVEQYLQWREITGGSKVRVSPTVSPSRCLSHRLSYCVSPTVSLTAVSHFVSRRLSHCSLTVFTTVSLTCSLLTVSPSLSVAQAGQKMKFCRIDGCTPLEQREEAINQYNAPDSDKFIFLLSIRAAGRGLNLQTSDTVIIYDPDPNPKNEEQVRRNEGLRHGFNEGLGMVFGSWICARWGL